MSGDADVGTAVFTMIGGSLSAVVGPIFYVTNTEAVVVLEHVSVTGQSGVLLNCSTNWWGTANENGGHLNFTANAVSLSGTVTADWISSISLTLLNNSELSGDVINAAVNIDTTSSWIVTGDSALTTLTASVDSETFTISNVYGNGYTVTYNVNLAGNSYLGGNTYTLADGGYLVPANNSGVSSESVAEQSTSGFNPPPGSMPSGFPGSMPSGFMGSLPGSEGSNTYSSAETDNGFLSTLGNSSFSV